jgi:hypothetical protein
MPTCSASAPPKIPHLEKLFRECAAGSRSMTALRFDAQSIGEGRRNPQGGQLRGYPRHAAWPGWTTRAARCRSTSAYGDAVTPAPENVQYPVMLDDMPATQLRVYPRYTVVAEKLEAMIKSRHGSTAG